MFMKRIFYLTIAAIVFISCSNSSKINFLTSMGLKGDVKSTFTYCYEAESRFGSIEKGDIIRGYEFPYWSDIEPASKVEYNKEGNIVKRTTYTKNGEINGTQIYEYDNSRFLSICVYGKDGEVTYSQKYYYQNGKLVDYESFSVYDKVHNYSHRYGIEDDKIILDSVFVGNELRSITSIQDNLHIMVDANGNEISRFIQELDECNRPLRLESINQEGSNFSDYIRSYTYNENGWLLSESEEIKSKMEKISYEYIDLDNMGNWISRAIYIDEKLKAIEERTIEYF